MGNHKLRGKDFKQLGLTSHKAKSIAIGIFSKHYKHQTKEDQLALLKSLLDDPQQYADHEHLSLLAAQFIDDSPVRERQEVHQLRERGDFTVFGRPLISSNAYQQMEMAMRLPVSVRGALMPDAHQGYGLPIGGVLATKNAVIPYGVGVDIGCRMSLSILDVSAAYFQRHEYQFKQALKEKTCFGTGGILSSAQDHEVLESALFAEIPMLKPWHSKAAYQLGTSGSGNHFVEFGEVNWHGDAQLPKGEYLGLLSHSGSRGMGAAIARHYTSIAMENSTLPRQARHLSWLDLDTEAGAEYWLAMNLAGDYAKACHDRIHENLCKHLGLKQLMTVENHHNFAWKELGEEGEELIVHRKGATPAAEGVMGIIPGSMTAPGYVVRGKGHVPALASASHGAGRRLSRKAARESYTRHQMKKDLSEARVTLIGGDVDEAPVAYKNLEDVMRFQQKLVEVVAEFQPRLVRMDKK